MNELWQGLRTHWQDQNLELSEVATLAEIESFEATHQLCVPDDFKSYLLNVNGIKNWHITLDFWSLQRIRSLVEDDTCADTPDAEQFFIFADHCIRIFDFAVRFTSQARETTPVYWVNWPPRQLTATFGEFIERYLAGDETIIYPD